MKAKIENSFKRVFLLWIRDINIDYRILFIGMAALTGIVFVFSFIAAFSNRGAGFHTGMFINILFLGGFMVASGSFRELGKAGGVHSWLMLPASPLEKYGSRLLITSIGYIAGLLAVYTAAAYLSEGFNMVILGRRNALFNPFSSMVLDAIPHFVIFQSIFFLGGVWFRKNHLLKTVAVITGAGILLFFIGLMMFRIVFHRFFDGAFWFNIPGAGQEISFIDQHLSWNQEFRSLVIVIQRVYQFALAPFFWITGYFRFRESEI